MTDAGWSCQAPPAADQSGSGGHLRFGGPFRQESGFALAFHQANIKPADQRRSLRLGASRLCGNHKQCDQQKQCDQRHGAKCDGLDPVALGPNPARDLANSGGGQ